MINYKIGDLVTRINNSYRAGSGCNPPQVLVEKTKDNYQILSQLIKLGCLANINDPTNLNKFSDLEKEKYFIVNLNFNLLNESKEAQASFIKLEDGLNSSKPKNKLTLVSKPGKRIYVGYKGLKDFNNGFKTYLLRTSKGIITSQTAIKLKLGGELLIKL